ncbi:S-methyl-5'-thioadenosine phosphorylase [Altererythrobacter sp. MF3-039]|uniref:S-methyl-5'-thioadenosine phosphorylase n=1 Tax=Altererythrobacter sp. MF3-039 TaxID=3252901 RepID=UPI00390C83AF
MSSEWTIGIIGGSGLYALDSLEDAQWIAVKSPFGEPSDEILCGRIGDVRVRFLPRHGRGHAISPTDLNARANIDALKRAGCTDILAISAVGSLREELPPGHFVAVDQFIDRTKARTDSFFGSGFVTHVSMADPVCSRMAELAANAVKKSGGPVTKGGTYLAMEGPQFSTRAESKLFREWGADVIGMTGYPEARLAREAELPYALLGMVTDYDAWRDDEEGVDVAAVIEQMNANSELARKTVEALITALPDKREPSPIDTALDDAVITAPDKHDPHVVAKLDAVAGRLLRAARGDG